MKNTNCYLDTSFLSILVRKNISDKTQIQAILRIYSFWKQGHIKCFVSEVVKRELEKIPSKFKKDNEVFATTYMLLDKAELFPTIYSRAGFGATMFGEAPFGGGVEEEDPIYLKLRDVFDEVDAEHIFQCIKNGIPYFVTYDIHSILNRARQHTDLLKELGIQVLTPKEFEGSLG